MDNNLRDIEEVGLEESKIGIDDFVIKPQRRWNNGLLVGEELKVWIKNTEHPASICYVLLKVLCGRAETKEVLFIREDDRRNDSV